MGIQTVINYPNLNTLYEKYPHPPLRLARWMKKKWIVASRERWNASYRPFLIVCPLQLFWWQQQLYRRGKSLSERTLNYCSMNPGLNLDYKIYANELPEFTRALLKTYCIAIYATQNPTTWRLEANTRFLNEGRLCKWARRRFTINQKNLLLAEDFLWPPINVVTKPSQWEELPSMTRCIFRLNSRFASPYSGEYQLACARIHTSV